jgi:hypothetical protein
MVAPQQGLKGFAGAFGFSLGALLLSALVGSAVAQNTAFGTGALASNTTGTNDSAFGFGALFRNTAGNDNTASGNTALRFNTTGDYNTASGVDALYLNTTGNTNTASGVDALYNNTTGKSNIGLGFNAGNNIMAGSNNIEIGSAGTSDESNTIRIGNNSTQNTTFIACISGTTVSGADVVVSSDGQLGVATSLARYKRDIHVMDDASAGLMRLRPMSFRYKSDPSGTLQYGLVAEEVERVYPELVTRGPDGKVQSVRYLEFTALLPNELQKLDERMQTKDQQIAAQQREIDALKQKDAASMLSASGSRRLSSRFARQPRRTFPRLPANKRSHSPVGWPSNRL